MDAVKNFSVGAVATAPSPATSGTSLVLGAGEGALFPAPPFNATICPANAPALASNAEIVRVTNVSTDTLTITREQESTSARSIAVGDQVFAGVTAKTLNDLTFTARYDPLTLDATYGDEFAGTSLDAKWTRRNAEYWDETWTNGWLQLEVNTGAVVQQYHQTAPSGDFTITLTMSLFSGASHMYGPMIINSSGAGISYSPYGDGNMYMWNMSAYTYSSTGVSYNGIPWALLGGGWRHWLQLNKSGTDYKGRYSLDGDNWSPWTPNQSWTGTVDRIGFGRIYGSSAGHRANIDRFNVTDIYTGGGGGGT